MARPPGVIAPAHLQRFPCQRAVQQQRADSRHQRDLRGHHLLAGGPLAKLLALRDERGSSLEQLVVHVHLVAHARPSVAAIPPSPLPCHPCHLLLRRCSPMLSPQKRAVATEAVAAELLPLLLYLPLLCRPLHLLLLPVL